MTSELYEGGELEYDGDTHVTHVWVELFVPWGEERGGHVQSLA